MHLFRQRLQRQILIGIIHQNVLNSVCHSPAVFLISALLCFFKDLPYAVCYNLLHLCQGPGASDLLQNAGLPVIQPCRLRIMLFFKPLKCQNHQFHCTAFQQLGIRNRGFPGIFPEYFFYVLLPFPLSFRAEAAPGIHFR